MKHTKTTHNNTKLETVIHEQKTSKVKKRKKQTLSTSKNIIAFCLVFALPVSCWSGGLYVKGAALEKIIFSFVVSINWKDGSWLEMRISVHFHFSGLGSHVA